MDKREYKDISITSAKFLLNVAGLGVTVNSDEERRRRYTLAFTVFVNALIAYWEIVDFRYTKGDLDHRLFSALTAMNTIEVLVKVSIMSIYRKEFVYIVLYAEENFWHMNYDPDEMVLLKKCRKFCKIFMITICVFAQATLSGYSLTPLLLSIGRNESERLLPIAIWTDLPITMTPYYQIIFIFQTICAYQIGSSYMCSNTFFCVLCMHVVCQFRLLRNRLKHLWTDATEQKGAGNYEDKCYAILKKYIQQHQSLVEYCDKLKNVYMYVFLVDAVVFAVAMCLDAYEFLLENVPITTRIIFIAHLLGSYTCMIFFLYACNNLTTESEDFSATAYLGSWATLPMNDVGRMLRKDILTIIMKSMRPCYISAGGFFNVSLETAIMIMSTTASYFTLIRETSMRAENK